MDTQPHTVTCRTEGCENFEIPIEVPEWAMVICGAGCNNFLQQEDPTHPDFPHHEPVESQEEMISRITAAAVEAALKAHGIIE